MFPLPSGPPNRSVRKLPQAHLFNIGTKRAKDSNFAVRSILWERYFRSVYLRSASPNPCLTVVGNAFYSGEENGSNSFFCKLLLYTFSVDCEMAQTCCIILGRERASDSDQVINHLESSQTHAAIQGCFFPNAHTVPKCTCTMVLEKESCKVLVPKSVNFTPFFVRVGVLCNFSPRLNIKLKAPKFLLRNEAAGKKHQIIKRSPDELISEQSPFSPLPHGTDNDNFSRQLSFRYEAEVTKDVCRPFFGQK